MSYDVSLHIDTGGEEPACIGWGRNMTSNVAPVWRAVGADVAEFDGKKAVDCLPPVVEGLRRLRITPRAYDHLVRGGGEWGTVESAIEFLYELEQDFRANPLATVSVSR
jgi:hypothetical protein